jgi:hypothetical protein
MAYLHEGKVSRLHNNPKAKAPGQVSRWLRHPTLTNLNVKLADVIDLKDALKNIELRLFLTLFI